MNRTIERETVTARATRGTDNVVIIRINQGAEQTLENAKENMAAIEELAGGARPPLLIDMSGARTLAPDVRHFYGDRALGASFSAVALVVEASPLGIMMGNLYLRVARNGVPMKLCTGDATALEWLSRFVPTR